jgi:hypothetical protein
MTADPVATGWSDHRTWSDVLDLIRAASWCAADRDDDPVAAADRLRTIGRMLDHAATIVREDEADRRRSRAVSS